MAFGVPYQPGYMPNYYPMGQQIEAKDAKIAEQNQQLFAAQLAASQAAQNETLKAYMSGQLAYYNPRPVPAFPVPAPYQYGNCGTCNGCGC